MAEGSSLIIFIIFVVIALFSAARAVSNRERKKKVKRRRHTFQPYQPPTVQRRYSPAQPSRPVQPTRPVQPVVTQPTPAHSAAGPQYQSRVAYASAEEYFRAGMYDKAKEEYLKTGRIFGAAKAVAAKGHEYVKEAIRIIQRYAPEREEEMVRNLSRYFFDSGDIETAAVILHEYGLVSEAEAVLATIGKTYVDILPAAPVEVTTVSFPTTQETTAAQQESTQTQAESTETIEPFAQISEEKPKVITEPELDLSSIEPQSLKLATTDLEARCSVCMTQIKAGDSFVRCPHCDAPAHYAHLIEWIKVKPQCPNCRKKLVPKMFQG